MIAYEFHAAIENGVIQVPPEYKSKISKMVKVILLSEDTVDIKNMDGSSQKTVFPYFAVDTTGYVFNREEANER